MHLFVKVIELNSFSAAAEELNIAHSTISKQISSLENNLNVQLIVRTTRKIRPTDEGIQFYKHCINIIGAVDNAWHSVSSSNTSACGCVRISAPSSLASRFLCRAISLTRNRFPELKIQLNVDDSTVDLVENHFDLTIRVGELENSSNIAQRIFTSKMTLCASPEYFQRTPAPKTPEDLKALNCLTYTYNGQQPTWLLLDPHTQQPLPTQVNGSFQADDCDLLCQVARCNEGLVYLPDFIVRRHIDKGELTVVMPEFHHNNIPIYVVYPPSKERPEKVKVFVDILKSVFKEPALSYDYQEFKSLDRQAE